MKMNKNTEFTSLSVSQVANKILNVEFCVLLAWRILSRRRKSQED